MKNEKNWKNLKELEVKKGDLVLLARTEDDWLPEFLFGKTYPGSDKYGSPPRFIITKFGEYSSRDLFIPLKHSTYLFYPPEEMEGTHLYLPHIFNSSYQELLFNSAPIIAVGERQVLSTLKKNEQFKDYFSFFSCHLREMKGGKSKKRNLEKQDN